MEAATTGLVLHAPGGILRGDTLYMGDSNTPVARLCANGRWRVVKGDAFSTNPVNNSEWESIILGQAK